METEDRVLRAALERKRRELERKRGEEELRNLDYVTRKYYLDEEAREWLGRAIGVLFRDYPKMGLEMRRRVVEELAGEITRSGPPRERLENVVRDAVNRCGGG